MSVIATAVRHLMAAGVTGEALILAIADMEAEQGSLISNASVRTARQERNARYYQKNKNEASENRLKASECVLIASDTSESVLKEVSPCSPSPSSCTSNPIPYNPLPEKPSTLEKWPFGKVVKGEFETFWTACPRKVGKGTAEKAYQTARKSATAEGILSAMNQHVRDVSATEAQFIPHPATWLNGKRFLDPVVGVQNKPVDRTDLKPWQVKLAGIIGDVPVRHWFTDAAVEGRTITVVNQFKADFIKRSYEADLRQIGIDFIQYQQTA